MTLAPPRLDRRTFDDLVAEARRRIARYTPEYAPAWTDHNDSDPGMTLVQVFSWLAASTSERVNALPERAYRTLLAMVGIDAKPAVPAEADLVFSAIPGTAGSAAAPRGTRVGAPPGPDGAPVVFETVAGLDVIRCDLAAVLAYDGTAGAPTEVTPLNEPNVTAILPFGTRPEVGAALYFGFAPPPAFPQGWQPFPGRVSLRAFEPARTTPPEPFRSGDVPHFDGTEMVWEYLPREGGTWQRLQMFEDQTGALVRGGYLALEGPPRDIEPARLAAVDTPLYWVRLRLRAADYGGRVPALDFFRFNAVPARHLTTVRDEPLGVSNGSPDQVFTLRHTPLVADTLELVVEGVEGEWRAVDFFRTPDPDSPDDPDAGPEAQVFRVDAQAGGITFGDGRRGLIPPAGTQVVARRYQAGGGRAGNVEARTITGLQASLPGLRGVENPRPARGGRDREPVADALRRAPLRLRRRERAVTVDDYRAAAEEVGGIARAHVLPFVHPEFPDLRVPGALTVLVVPETDQIPPMPSDTALRRVGRALEPQRTVATELFVRAPTFVRVEVWADLLIDPERSLGAATTAAIDRFNEYLNPFAWPFGANLYPANLYHQVLALRDEVGIVAVGRLEIRVNGRPHPSPVDPIVIADGALVYPGAHRLDARPYEES